MLHYSVATIIVTNSLLAHVLGYNESPPAFAMFMPSPPLYTTANPFYGSPSHGGFVANPFAPYPMFHSTSPNGSTMSLSAATTSPNGSYFYETPSQISPSKFNLFVGPNSSPSNNEPRANNFENYGVFNNASLSPKTPNKHL